MNYPVLHLYQSGGLQSFYLRIKGMTPRDTELAAAFLSRVASEEYGRLQEDIKGATTPEQETLCDWLVDHWNIRRELQELSGSCSLMEDSLLLADYAKHDTRLRDEELSELGIDMEEAIALDWIAVKQYIAGRNNEKWLEVERRS